MLRPIHGMCISTFALKILDALLLQKAIRLQITDPVLHLTECPNVAPSYFLNALRLESELLTSSLIHLRLLESRTVAALMI